jgi:iron complex transport system permease protein
MRAISLSMLLLGLLAAVGVISLGIGAAPIAPSQVIAAVTGDLTDGPIPVIVRDIRLPRLVLAILVGAALAVAGVAMQGFFQNPMADPYIVGVSSGAALGATIGLVFRLNITLLGISTVPLLAFGGALSATFLVYALALRGGRVPVVLLLLIGVAVGALASAATSFIMIVGDEDTRIVLYWLLGSLSSRGWTEVWMILPYVCIGIFCILLYARDLNLLLLGEETAQHTGVDVERVKRIVLAASALLAAAAVSVSGIIGFVGLVVPHVVRLIVGPDHRRLIPVSAIGGALLLVVADIGARSLIAPAEIPVGIITSVIGCPFFLFLIARRREISL